MRILNLWEEFIKLFPIKTDNFNDFISLTLKMKHEEVTASIEIANKNEPMQFSRKLISSGGKGRPVIFIEKNQYGKYIDCYISVLDFFSNIKRELPAANFYERNFYGPITQDRIDQRINHLSNNS